MTELPWPPHTCHHLIYWDLWEDDLRSAELRLTSVVLLYKPYYRHKLGWFNRTKMNTHVLSHILIKKILLIREFHIKCWFAYLMSINLELSSYLYIKKASCVLIGPSGTIMYVNTEKEETFFLTYSGDSSNYFHCVFSDTDGPEQGRWVLNRTFCIFKRASLKGILRCNKTDYDLQPVGKTDLASYYRSFDGWPTKWPLRCKRFEMEHRKEGKWTLKVKISI